jgi:hypothetical protein
MSACVTTVITRGPRPGFPRFSWPWTLHVQELHEVEILDAGSLFRLGSRRERREPECEGDGEGEWLHAEEGKPAVVAGGLGAD